MPKVFSIRAETDRRQSQIFKRLSRRHKSVSRRFTAITLDSPLLLAYGLTWFDLSGNHTYHRMNGTFTSPR